jgi:iron complex transport system substrate-binding protein
VLIGVSLVGAVAATVLAADRRGANITSGCLTRFDPAADYFPDKLTIEDAANFTVEYRKSYKVVAVREAYAGAPPERYVLVQCGSPPPALTGDLRATQIVTVPVTSLFAFSPTHLSLLVDLGRLDVLTGMARRDLIVDADVDARIKTGKVTEFAKVGPIIDVERVVAAKPSMLMAGGVSNAAVGVITSAGIAVVANSEWLESSALGRAEWLKYMALFLNEERKAESVYGAMKSRYQALSARAAAQPESERPLVITGRSTRGMFVIAGGRSYVAALITDAGGRYAWADNTSVGSATVDLEAQIRRGADADVWINGGGWKNLAAMLEDEPRYSAFKAYRSGRVWVYERRQQANAANDYWSRSVTHPDLVLADLVKIFHSALAGDHTFEWYMPVAR